MSCFNRQGEVKADDAKYTGTEPTWDDVSSLTDKEVTDRLSKGLAFYAYYCNKKDLLPDLINYMTNEGYGKEEIKLIKKHFNSISLLTTMKIVRMFNRGCPKNVDEGTSNSFVIQSIDSAISKARELDLLKKVDVEEDDKPKVPQISPMQRLINKCNLDVIVHCEVEIDAMIEGVEYKPINITNLLGQSEMSAKGCELILQCLHKEVMDFEMVQSGKDEQLLEAFNFVGKRQMSKVIRTIRDWICDVEKYRQTVKKTTVRVKKVKPASTQVKDLNYDKDNSKISPVKIPGSVDTIIFNSKTRKLQVYKAVGRQGLSVKGTSIKDFDDVKSYQVTVRENMIESVVGKDPKALEKIISPKTKRTKVNGRVNEHCRIVYVK